MIEVIVPEVGEIVGGDLTLVSWHKREGETVRAGEPLFQLDTVKTLLDVEAYTDGRLVDVAAKEGDVVTPHQVIARLAPLGTATARATDSPQAAAPPSAASSTNAPAASVPPVRERRRDVTSTSPRARRLSASAGVDLGSVVGTGPGGRITERDVEAAAGGTTRAARARRATAEITAASWRTIPHIHVRADIDLTAGLERTRPTTLVCAAATRALVAHPECNIAWSGERLSRRAGVDLGLLVDTPDGLLLTAIRGADQLDLMRLERALEAAAARARAGKLEASDFAPRSITISNLGMFSVDQFDGIIPAGDVMLLTLGRATERARWIDGAWRPRRVAQITVSVDHRALDGADAARFLTTFEQLVARPEGLE